MSNNTQPHISLIAALGTHTRAIGKGNALLWRIPEDQKRFKTLTMGHPIIMGRATFDSIGRPLPGRTNIVLTKDADWSSEGITPAHTLDEALTMAASLDPEEVFVIGGGQVYTQAIDRADRLYLTLVDDDTPGDTPFTPYEHLPFQTIENVSGSYEGRAFRFLTLERNHN